MAFFSEDRLFKEQKVFLKREKYTLMEGGVIFAVTQTLKKYHWKKEGFSLEKCYIMWVCQ